MNSDEQIHVTAQAGIEYRLGIPESLRESAAVLFDSAFGGKFSAAVPDTEKRVVLFGESLDLRYAFAAIHNGELAGLAGYMTDSGSFTHGLNYSRLIKHLGIIGGNRAAAVFSLYERKPEPNQLLMDGIAVASRMQGRGIGTRLLSQISIYAAGQGFDTIRLDVIDTNADARRLYERNGFVATKTEHFEYLRWLLGFGRSTTLIRNVREPVK